tara:strand:- start:25531 stop:26067 length:537 start_codon:yes stop_codon:yes gene_type:complete
MKIQSKDIVLVDVNSLTENPENANRHSVEQIERLSEIIKYQGFRNPITISNRTGFIVAGHGRLMAAKVLEMEQVPVIYQDFENEAQEYSYLISDNEIARWAELDLHLVHEKLKDMPELEIELLGIENFTLEKIEDTKDESTTIDEEKFLIVIECKDELEQADFFDEFQTREITCKLMS